MNRVVILLLLLVLSATTRGQIFKKNPPKTPSALDKIKVYEHFRAETLDTVYNTLHDRYGLNIVYDTAYCNSVIFSYWYTGTPAPLALEITTRGNDLSYTTDSLNVIHIKAKHPHKILLPKAVNTANERKYKYTPVNTSFTLKGHIVDDSTSDAVVNAVISVEHSSLSANSDGAGAFVFQDMPSDTMTLLVSATGYKEQRIKLNQGMDKNELVIGIAPDIKMLEEAIIKGKKEELFKMNMTQVSAIKLTPSKLAEIPNVGEKDIMRTFQLMPGISAANESSSGLYVRGGTPDQNLVLYDGFTVYQVDHLYGFFSAFNANAVKDATIYKGGFDAKYGGRLSSVTDMTGKEGSTKQFNIGGDLSLLSMNLFTEIPVTDNLSVVAAVRKSWQGPIYDWIFNSFNRNTTASQPSGGGPGGADGVTKARSYFYDVNTRVTFRPTKKDLFYYSFFNGCDDLNNGFTINTPPFLAAQGITLNIGTTDVTKYSNTGMALAWLRKWSKNINSNTTLSYSNYQSSRDRVTTGSFFRPGDTTTTKTGIFENNNLKDLSVRSDWEWNISKWNQVGIGAFGTKYDITYSYSHNDTSLLLDKDDPGLLAGAYLQDKLNLFDGKVSITPGVRLSYFDATNKTYTEPRLSLNYNIAGNLSFKTAYGKYYQFANRITREDITAGSSQFWVLADGTSVPVSSATHYIAGLSYEKNGYSFGIEGYYKQLSDLSQFSERNVANATSINYETAFYTGNGESKGIEFMVQKSAGRFTGWASYTLASTMYHFPIYGSGWFPADQDVNHEVKLVGMYKYKHWDFAATWIYASGKPYTAPGGTYAVTLLDGTTQNYFTTTSKNTLRLPDYHRMDISVNYHFYNEKKKDIGYIGLSLFNVYARNNVWYKQFTVVDNSVIETNVNYLSFTPNLTLSLKMR